MKKVMLQALWVLMMTGHFKKVEVDEIWQLAKRAKEEGIHSLKLTAFQ